MVYLPSLDVDKEVEVFQEICTQERNRYWSQLERAGINFRISSTRETEVEELSAVRRQTPSEESDFGPGNTEMEAPSQPKTHDQRGYLDGIVEKNYTAPEQPLEQAQTTALRNRQAGKGAPSSGLLFFRL